MIVSRLRSRGIQAPSLELNGHQLEKVLEYKYLGVTLASNLSWSEHVDTIVCKTRKLVGMLYRQFYHWSSTEALLVLPTLHLPSETTLGVCLSCVESLHFQGHQ